MTETTAETPEGQRLARAGEAMLCRAGCSGARGWRSCGSGCGRRWPRSRPRRACSSRCPGSGSGSGCRRSAAPSAWSRSSCSPWRRPCRWSCVRLADARSTGCAGSTAAACCRTGRRPRSPTGWRPRRAIRSRSRSGARMWSARLRAARALKAGLPVAAARRARSVRAARAGAGAGGRDVLRRRRRALQARRRGLRLARRGHAGELPHRRLGDAAGLYRPAAADPAGPAPRRAVAGAQRRAGGGAGRLDAGGPRHRTDPVSTSRSTGGLAEAKTDAAPRRRRRRAPRSAASPSPTPAPPPCAASATS